MVPLSSSLRRTRRRSPTIGVWEGYRVSATRIARHGGPTRGGSPLRPRPSPGQRRKHLGSQRNGAHRPPWTRRASRQAKGIAPSAHGGTVRLNNRDPRHCPASTTRTVVDDEATQTTFPEPQRNKPAHPLSLDNKGPRLKYDKTRRPLEARGHPSPNAHPPDSSGSDKATPANGRAPAEGQMARATARDGQRRSIAKANRTAHQRRTAAPTASTNEPPPPPTAPTPALQAKGAQTGNSQQRVVGRGRKAPAIPGGSL
ncbi:hypothetical protein WOLCODRAFT_158329 [Wolfiporia cocos MD-104 SS10]|uniref:Uncharacterized protein n=1 Tax=Wolfiporia cocos (strain MD-104) TaxID=742152 RepID=A0A2H3J6Q4_WOLCO|nr:hypothetical protein WOLCODRAFT_158329 [Wolfiporia cocos MD-104 SS10]